MTDNELKEIRQKISCPQLCDKHYGEWGILTKSQRFTIKRMLDYIDAQEKHINRLQAENERLSKITRPLIGEIKAEAYTEFAELLCKIWQRFEDENICGISNQGLVKFVCKEMVGEDNVD